MNEELTALVDISGAAVIASAVFIVLALLVVPKNERNRLRLPTVFLVLYGLAFAVAHFTPDTSPVHTAFEIIALFFLMMSLSRSVFLLLHHAVITRSVKKKIPKIIHDLVQALFVLGGIFIVLHEMGVNPASLLGASALLTAVVGFALQDTLGNLFAGLAIQLQAPFEVGDFVRFDPDNDHVGCVVEMNWRTVKIITLERLEVIVPNALLAKAPVENYSKPSKVLRRSAYVVAPFEMRPERIHRVLADAVMTVKGVLATPVATVITHDFDERGVVYHVRYFINDFPAREVIAGEVLDRLWYALQREGGSVPAPRRTVYMHEVNRETIARQEDLRAAARLVTFRHVDFLAALPEEACMRLAQQAQTRFYAPGERIIQEGDEGDELFIIQEGEVRVMITRRARGEKEVARLGPDQFFGEMSLMTGEQRKASIVAATETALLVLDKSAFRPILDENPDLAKTISDVLAARTIELGESQELESGIHQDAATERASVVLLDRIKQFFSLGS